MKKKRLLILSADAITGVAAESCSSLANSEESISPLLDNRFALNRGPAMIAEQEIQKYLDERPKKSRAPRRFYRANDMSKSFAKKMEAWEASGPMTKDLTMNIYVLDEKDVLAMVLKDRRMKKSNK